MKTMHRFSKWFWVALASALIAAPNATVIRYSVNDADPLFFIASRFGLVALVCLPFVLRSIGSFSNTSARKYVLYAAVEMSIAIICYVFAIFYSQASYVSIITLITPIIFIILSAKLIGDRVNSRAVVGITLAAIGATVLVVLPLAFSNPGVAFYPLATVLSLINSVAFALALIHMRKANEAGVSLWAVLGVSSSIAAIVASVLFVVNGDSSRLPGDAAYWLAVVYSGVGVALIARALNIFSYEHVGSAVISAMQYLGTLLAILIPVFVLNEKLSVEMVIGGILILIGVYVVESHKHPHTKYLHFHHHH